MEREIALANGKEKKTNEGTGITAEHEENIAKTTLRLDADLFWDLKQQAAEERRNLTVLVNEAVYDLLVKRGKRKPAKK